MGNAFDQVLARALVEAAPDGFFITDSSGTIVDVNPAGAALFGWPREELIGKPVVTLVPDDLTDAHITGARRFTTDPSATTRSGLIARGRRKDGTEFPAEISLGVIETEPGRLFFASIRDISDRRRTLDALQVAEERLRHAQKVARLGSWDWDLRTNVVYRSPELLQLYGLDPALDADAPVFALTRLIPEDERERVLEEIELATRRGLSYAIEHRVIRPDGDERVFLERGETVFRDGVPVRSFGTTQDITELRKAERERAEALVELRTVLEECPIGITIVRGSDAAMEANRHARTMQGRFDPESGLAQFRGTLLRTDGEEMEYEEYPAIRALRGERIEREEYLFRRDDEHVIPIEVKAVPITDVEGRVTTAVVVWEDLSNVKEIERLRAEWNSVVAHDLRQPINTINLYAQLLARAADRGTPGSWSDEALEYVREIRKMIGRLTRMTNDLLDLSRLDASRLKVERRPMDLAACVRESVAHAALLSPQHQLDVRVEEEIPTIEADPDRLAQVMENLLTNAIKYGQPTTPIRVSVEKVAEAVAVAVTSKGDAIEAKDLERIFERFERAGVAAHRAVPGIGLGLQITQGLVLAHGGRIGATSTNGETTFRFTIPIARAQAAQVAR